jgi:sulfide:quinone oxidoreductase
MKETNEIVGVEETVSGMDRRQFLKIASTSGLMIYLGACNFSNKTSSAKGKVVIVGGGAAGLSMAAVLHRWIEDPDITLIDPSNRQYYQPGFTLIASGVYKPEEVWRDQETCIPANTKWIKESVISIDPEKNQVFTDTGKKIDYDFLVLTPGIQINWNLVEGISRESLGTGNAHSIYDFEGATKTWQALQKFSKAGGRGIFTDTYTKHKCGGAPKKINLLAEHLTRKEGTRDQFSFNYFSASGQLYDIPYFTPRLEEIYSERNINLNLNVRIKGIDTSAKKVFFEKHEKTDNQTSVSAFEENYDFLHFTPPMSAPDFIKESGLSWTEGKLSAEGWVMTNKDTLVHEKYKNIVCLGDCAGIPTSKTSAAIRKQVPVAAKNLISLMEENEPAEIYDGYAACPIITEYGKVLLCEFNYRKEPQISFPFSLLDMSKEQKAAWFLKVKILKPMYFEGMLNGYML